MELTQSFNSMYRWYQDATLCFTYLADFCKDQNSCTGKKTRTRRAPIKNSVSFTRGWTLQELVAPTHVEFFDQN